MLWLFVDFCRAKRVRIFIWRKILFKRLLFLEIAGESVWMCHEGGWIVWVKFKGVHLILNFFIDVWKVKILAHAVSNVIVRRFCADESDLFRKVPIHFASLKPLGLFIIIALTYFIEWRLEWVTPFFLPRNGVIDPFIISIVITPLLPTLLFSRLPPTHHSHTFSLSHLFLILFLLQFCLFQHSIFNPIKLIKSNIPFFYHGNEILLRKCVLQKDFES